ncbi:helix-turn-helix transcriptional regulator [Ideonella paludis]|uniref:Helix-turn-helix domain-containing protein n=1 Tax=Ideonella paludis TaxID=1233411 RepID=A0ABS5DSU2_9BURK|nr:helix-turn-helix domain-containing protein [Ideonella paludis]MBQ0934212.1 helix-turn-helix domain-containing protein [Ideonella paludis]
MTTPGLARFQEVPVLPRIAVGAARALYVEPGLNLSPHVNATVTVALALQGSFGLRLWGREKKWSEWQTLQAACIPAQTLHHLRAAGPMVFLYLDPLADVLPNPSPSALSQGRARLLALPQPLDLDNAFAAMGLQAQGPQDRRIASVARALDRQPDQFNHLREAAAMAGLSGSRFRARFAKEVGLPFRRYRLWRRMAVVMRELAAGHNLTTAAMAAGFASASHLSSSFKQMFGLAPSALAALGVEIDLSADPAGFVG